MNKKQTLELLEYLRGYGTSVVSDSTFFEETQQDISTSSLPRGSIPSKQDPWATALFNLTNNYEELKKRMGECEQHISENKEKLDNIDRMCESISSLSNLIYWIAIVSTVVIAVVVVIIFYICRAGIVFNTAVMILGGIGLINIKPIFSITNRIKNIEKDVVDLKNKLK